MKHKLEIRFEKQAFTINKTLSTLAFILLCTTTAFSQVFNYHGKPLNIAKLEQTISHAMDSLDVPGMSVAIINKGKVVYCKGLGFANIAKKKKVTATTFFEAASMSKPVFSYYVLTLAREGKIDLAKPLYEYLPEPDIEDERYKEITAQMVLSHTTGLPNWRETPKMKLAFNPGQDFVWLKEGNIPHQLEGVASNGQSQQVAAASLGYPALQLTEQQRIAVKLSKISPMVGFAYPVETASQPLPLVRGLIFTNP